MKSMLALAALCYLPVAQAQMNIHAARPPGYDPCYSLATVRFPDIAAATRAVDLIKAAELGDAQYTLHAPFRSIVVRAQTSCNDSTWWDKLTNYFIGYDVQLMHGVNIDGHSYPVSGIAMCVVYEEMANNVYQYLVSNNCSAKMLKHMQGQTMILVQSEEHSLEELLIHLNSINGVVHAYPDHIFEMQYDLNVNDPAYSDQWFLPAINAGQAWDITTGNPSVIVAVIDGGFQTNHPDMAGRITNAYDAVDDDYTLTIENTFDTHGTPCMGLVAARTNNAVGVASVGFNIKVMPIDFNYNNQPNGSFTTSVAIIARAADHVVSIPNVVAVSNSYSSSNYNQLRLDEYEVMRTQSRGGLGAVLLASMGNDGSQNSPAYPAWYSNFISVASTDYNDERASTSNYGTMTHVAAPGVSTYTIDVGSGYDYFSGTSAACPIAAGVVGLMASMDLTLSEMELRDLLESTCEKVGGYSYSTNGNYPNGTWSTELGYGRINAYNAVVAASGAVPNDACDGAIELVSGPTCSYTMGTVMGAGPDGFPNVPLCDDADTHPSCTGTPSRHGVFYKFTAQSAAHVITVDPLGTGSGSLDAVITVYEGSDCFNLTEEECEDVMGGAGLTTSLSYNGYVPGNDYWIRVYDWCTVTALTNGDFQICITHQSAEDITIENVAGLQLSYSPGQSIAFQCEQCYAGATLNADLPNPDIIAYLSTSCDPADALDMVIESSAVGSNNPCNTESFVLDIPIGTPPGTYYVIVQADAYDDIAEGNGENNNTQCLAITVTGLQPDLTVSNLSLNYTEVCPGQGVQVTYTISNVGAPGTVGALTQTGFWVIPVGNGCPTVLPSPPGFVDAENLFPAAMSDDQEVVQVPVFLPVLPEGDYLLAIVADHNADLPEVDDDLNNISCIPFSVNIAAEPVAAIVTGDLELCAGESTTLTITNYDFTYQAYLWSTGSTAESIVVSTPGTYSVLAYGNGNCSESALTEVTVTALNVDTDGDGLPDCSDGCPSVQGDVGSPCDDGNACTANDELDGSCACTGTPVVDSDGDGLCDTIDPCPVLADLEPGDSCDDGDPCTTNDQIGLGCGCAGTTAGDADGDGLCDLIDPCPALANAEPGDGCNDGDPCTTNDQIDQNCGCAGTPVGDADGDGLCDLIDPCPTLANTEPGDSCDDGDPCTVNDQISVGCSCVGTPAGDTDNDGLCDAIDPCPTLAGIEPGDSCDDGDPCTFNDQISAGCSCAGTPGVDSDGDGLCDTIDPCPTLADVEPGDGCDDGDVCTTNDAYDVNCQCAGVVDGTDTDGDGAPDCADTCPSIAGQIGSPCDDGLANTVNDSLNTDCDCVGELATLVAEVGASGGWLSVQPNPSSGTFVITTTGSSDKGIEIRVFDALGHLVCAPWLVNDPLPQVLDLQQHAPGIYVLRAVQGTESTVVELVITR